VTIRVVVAEDSLLVREGIAKLLEAQADIEVVALVEDLPTLLEAVASDPPDVVVTDIRMPPTGSDEGVQAATQLRETNPELGVVVLSQYAEPAYVLALLEGLGSGPARRCHP
jgi:DNA-binding NarL/FixJ family response regulator